MDRNILISFLNAIFHGDHDYDEDYLTLVSRMITFIPKPLHIIIEQKLDYTIIKALSVLVPAYNVASIPRDKRNE